MGNGIRRLLPFLGQQMVGPWIFFDHLAPTQFSPGEGINVRPHPHINLATVTYLLEGEMLHRDSLGSFQKIKPGDLNLMVAGRGITHSERQSEKVKETKHGLHALQLWHVLPEKDEEMQPEFHHYDAVQLPNVSEKDVELRIMIGEAYGLKSPVKTFAKTIYVEAKLSKNSTVILPKAEELGIYVISGEIEIGGIRIPQFSMAILENDLESVSATEDALIVIIGGEKMSERFIEWNFVSSRKERIEQAKEDWRQGKFAKVVGDEEEFIELPRK